MLFTLEIRFYLFCPEWFSVIHKSIISSYEAYSDEDFDNFDGQNSTLEET